MFGINISNSDGLPDRKRLGPARPRLRANHLQGIPNPHDFMRKCLNDGKESSEILIFIRNRQVFGTTKDDRDWYLSGGKIIAR
jgi:hypothetical protein